MKMKGLKHLILGTVLMHSALAYAISPDLEILTDDELSATQAQALMSLEYISPTSSKNLESTRVGGDRSIGFYTLSMEADISINANIKRLQLGCGGVNGVGCDLDIQDYALGCIANAANVCITSSKIDSRQPDGVVQEGVAGSAQALGLQNKMKDFLLTNPYVQFAIKNPDQASQREIVGYRIGAANVSGPMSFGSLNTFSGVMTGVSNIRMRGETDVAVTSQAQARYTDAKAFLGIPNAQIISLLGYTIDYRDLTADYDDVERNGLNIVAEGTRLSQINIPGARMGDLVDEMLDTLEVNRVCARSALLGGQCSYILNATVAGALMPVLRGGVAEYMKQQLIIGLGGTPTNATANHNWLNNYAIPYNLKNVHQIEVASDVFGIALSKAPIQYPGYIRQVNRGWSMYIPDGFELTIDNKVSNFMQNITANDNAKNGDIILLQAPYRNCWGTLKFC